MRLLLRTVVVLGVLAAVGFGSYWGVRLLEDNGQARAERPPSMAPALAEFQAAFEADRLKPRLDDALINGIHVGVDVQRKYDSGFCNPQTAPPQYTDPDKTIGTDLEIPPGLLPAAFRATQAEAVECGGVIVAIERMYNIPPPTDISVVIDRLWVGPGQERAWNLYGAAERIGPITVGGKKGVVERAIKPPFDTTTIVLYEDFGITVVRADLSVEETAEIAERLK
ncbi:MAG: hypothetical protein ACUVV3_05170 [Dehalococcoidia bacterium]